MYNILWEGKGRLVLALDEGSELLGGEVATRVRLQVLSCHAKNSGSKE